MFVTFILTPGRIDQLANLHFHFTSVPRCTPGVEVQRNTDGDTPSTGRILRYYRLVLNFKRPYLLGSKIEVH